MLESSTPCRHLGISRTRKKPLPDDRHVEEGLREGMVEPDISVRQDESLDLEDDKIEARIQIRRWWSAEDSCARTQGSLKAADDRNPQRNDWEAPLSGRGLDRSERDL